jgi:sulfur relay protein TusB/DsrH
MAALHIVNSSSERRAALDNCLRAASRGDTILLIGNGVYWAVASTFTGIAKRASDTVWCALAPDAKSRGIGDLLSAKVQQIDDGAFVDLVASHHPVASWS